MKTIRNVIINGEDVECEVHYVISNDGIGVYEYWGQHCFDYGRDYIEVEDIIPVNGELSDELFNQLHEKVAEQMEEDGILENYEPDDDGEAWSGGFADNH